MGGLIGRGRELEALDDACDEPRAHLAVVWGRRRVGKTYLLEAFTRARRSIYYTAAQQSQSVELAGFTDTVRQTLGATGLPPGYAFPDWAVALDFVGEHALRERIVVVLDEFPYLAASTPGLESIVQRWWDQRGRASRLMLVLCGSAVAYMRQITTSSAPLHQRATLVLHVAALDYRSAGDFLPGLSAADRAVVYGILGGTPLYLEQWDSRKSRRENLLRLFGRPSSPLVDAAELVLAGELPEIEGALRIMQAVALGHTRPSEIGDYARVATERPLQRLTGIGLLERRAPALDDPARTKRAIYRIVDPYFAFWFRFVASHRASISRGLGAQLVDGRILPGLDDHMGGVFEEMAREHARGLAASGTLSADSVAQWWSADGRHEIDLVGMNARRPSFVGAVKWSSRRLGRDVLASLDEHAAALPGVTPGMQRLLYGRSGCLPEVAREPGVRCFSVDDMYARSQHVVAGVERGVTRGAQAADSAS